MHQVYDHTHAAGKWPYAAGEMVVRPPTDCINKPPGCVDGTATGAVAGAACRADTSIIAAMTKNILHQTKVLTYDNVYIQACPVTIRC